MCVRVRCQALSLTKTHDVESLMGTPCLQSASVPTTPTAMSPPGTTSTLSSESGGGSAPLSSPEDLGSDLFNLLAACPPSPTIKTLQFIGLAQLNVCVVQKSPASITSGPINDATEAYEPDMVRKGEGGSAVGSSFRTSI